MASEPTRKALTFQEVRAVNVARCNRWHPNGLASWSVADWAVAMAGEAGEVCNAVKKLRRVEDDLANLNDGDRHLDTRVKAVAQIGEEIADTFLYLNLLAARLGIDLESEVIAKFNSVSEKYGFPERLPAAATEQEGG
jgi:NTP pyrophosphatase (non-canonical NTP hydrolase)